MANPNRQTLDEWLREQGQLPNRPSRQINTWEDMTQLEQALPPPIGSTSIPNSRQSDVAQGLLGPAPPVPSARPLGVAQAYLESLRPAPLASQHATLDQGNYFGTIEPLRELSPSQSPIELPEPIVVEEQFHGPLNWPDVYPNFESVGTGYNKPWVSKEHREFYMDMLAEDGFTLKDWNTDRIYQGTDNPFDHSVWKVYRMEGTGQASEEVTYACKVVGLRYYKTKRSDYKIAVNLMLKEAQLLLRLDQINVVKVIANLPLHDQKSSFPFSFMAIIMEFMDGTLQCLIKDQPKGIMNINMCRSWFIDVARGLEYLHYNIRGPGDTGLVVTHMALSPKNILYKIMDANASQYVFKLSDFEECMTYETADPDSFQMDMVCAHGKTPYKHALSAPELRRENWTSLNLRARPTDIYSLALCLAYAIEGDVRAAKELVRSLRMGSILQFERTECHLIMAMTNLRPTSRPDIRQVLQHKWVTGVDSDKDEFHIGN